ncbi:MAG: DNA-binding protein, partial [Methylobacter sp.]|nr:DNA-binding protein [Methylobacter sp.]
MNNVSQINKAKRLSEEEVHAAAEELKESGIRPSSIEVYKFLGRGSLTTITNFLKTWDQADIQAATLPALAILPDALKKATELMIIKVWT